MTIRKEIGNKRGARESSKSKKEEADEGQKMGVNILMFLHPLRSRRGWLLLSFLPPLTLLTESSFLKQITAWPLSDRPPVAPMAHKVGNSPQSLQGCAITTPLYIPSCQHKRHTSPPPLYSLIPLSCWAIVWIVPNAFLALLFYLYIS